MPVEQPPLVLPLIPWTGGLNRMQNRTLAHHSQLTVAKDIVYGFDGTRRARGGQSHRNRVPIPGGVLDDHFTREPPGLWAYTASSFLLTHTNDNSSYRGAKTGTGTTTITRSYDPRFPLGFALNIRMKTNAISGSSSTYFEIQVQGGTETDKSKIFLIRLRADSIAVAVTSSTPSALSSSIGTYEETIITTGTELYDPNKYHTWKFELVNNTMKLYFDEILFFTTNTIVVNSAGTGAVTLSWVSGEVTSTIDVEVDALWIGFAGITESVVQALFDLPRPATKPFDRVDIMIAAVNGRIYQDPGDHYFKLILDNYGDGEADANTFFSFAAFDGDLIIARSGGKPLMRWRPGQALAEPLPGNPPRGSLLRVHRSRLWVGGDPKHPSRLYWSAFLDEESWTTEEFGGDFVDSGFEDIDPEDGGFLTGLGPSWQGELPVYKNTGIYRWQGDDPENFTFFPLTKKIGAIGHHAIQNVLNDQYFLSPFGAHSLLTTDKFGDLEASFLTSAIRELWNDDIRRDLLAKTWAVNNEPLDRYEVLTGFEDDDRISAEHLNRILSLTYASQDELHPTGRWSVKHIRGGSIILFQDEDSRNHVFVGGTDGFVNRQDERFTHDFPIYKATPD